ncbi:lipopolysaccharide biosynthesis protein [Turicibacter sanguinis]|uniref:lipopolysaccharide biosynthesis protein n=1 Tax=Turicibacter sanguinis TaxID=154288 RepID=UPI0018A8FFF0|nr:lipopolysaccharide biosynthesis protein [Turicibacter sanguinis]MDB8567898.1 lipopolysaccharide biosynthesis protein [Turicibacter sanguinis]MDB8570647.1 lipopolysaccharide biosynthesis protein [Turicibacter sanguinis]MDB8573400.1 lipopolysaccharide biosynthesis protein [Turicibacter sanguinis]MDB8582160.1 lipopolysaccharide biosynthesis protein [Turicibacter sanguinis]
MNNKDNFFGSLLRFAIGPLGAALISFITVPITTWLVTPEQFGFTTMFTLLQTLITSFIYLGLDQAYVREYNNKNHSKNKLLFNCILLPLILSFITIFCLVLFMEPISIYLFSEVNQILMNCLIIWIPFVVIERFLLLSIRMEEKGIEYSLYNILTKIFIMILTIGLLLLYQKTYTSIVLGMIISQIISCSILMILLRKQLVFWKESFDSKLIKEMLKFGLPILPSVLIVWVLNSTDRIILNQYCDIQEIGIYFAAMKLVTTLNMIQSIFSTFWVPLAYRWHEEGVEKEQFEKVSYGLGIVMGIVFISVLFFKSIMIMILAPDYSEAQFILPFLLFSPIMYTMSETTTLGIAFSRKTYFNILVSLIAAVINLSINFLLVPYVGGIGAAIGTGIAYISFFWVRTIISRRYWYNFELKFYLINILVLLFLATINVIITTKYIYILNLLFLFIFIFINIPYINKIIKLRDFIDIIRVKYSDK